MRTHAVAAVHQLAKGVDHRQPGADRRLEAQAAAVPPPPSRSSLRSAPAAGQRPLVGEHQVEALAERLGQQVGGLLGGDVDQHRPRDRVRRDAAERLAGRGRAPAQVARAARRRPCSRASARRARATGRAGRRRSRSGRARRRCGCGRRPVRRGHLRQRAADAAEAEQHHVGASACRRPGRRRSCDSWNAPWMRARRLGGLRLVDDERDVELGGALRDRDHVDAAARRAPRRRAPRCPACRPCRCRPRPPRRRPPRFATPSTRPVSISASNACVAARADARAPTRRRAREADRALRRGLEDQRHREAAPRAARRRCARRCRARPACRCRRR